MNDSVRSAAFRALVFLASFLLFEIELIAAKLLLPRFGSSASVWTTSLVFFQGALLVGYLIAALVARRASYRWAHLALVGVPLLALPLHLPELALPPVLAVLATLAIGVGLPYLALSTTSIVLQRWLHLSGLPGASDPAFLYGTSNAGALFALLVYPTILEPALDLHAQLALWYAGYALFVLLHLVCVPPPRDAPDAPPVRLRLRPAWLLLSAAGSALLMAATNVLTGDLSVPLLWALPLALYLGTLVLAFAPRPVSPEVASFASVAALLMAAIGLVLTNQREHYELGAILVHDGLLLVGCLLAHLALSRLRPDAQDERAGYFLAIALGGFLGSLLLGVVLPALGVPFEYLDYLVALGLLILGFAVRDSSRLARWLGERRSRAVLVLAGLAAIAVTSALAVKAGKAASVDASRTFYGMYRVSDSAGLRYFEHGKTVHGVESLDPARRGEPLSYYHRASPIGRLLQSDLRRERVAVVGLGVGSLAAYARAGERWDFYELDAEVERLARKDFDFLSRSAGELHVVIGDARQSLRDAPEGAYDVIVLDAFSSDLVPVHLVDREALALYVRKLKPDGLLVFHLSSRLLDMVPVLGRLADDANLRAAVSQGLATDEPGAFASLWLAMARDAAGLGPLRRDLGWQPLEVTPELRARRVWTDDYVNLFDAVRR